MNEIEALKELMIEKFASIALALDLKNKELERRLNELYLDSKEMGKRQEVSYGKEQDIRISVGMMVTIVTLLVAVIGAVAYIIIRK